MQEEQSRWGEWQAPRLPAGKLQEQWLPGGGGGTKVERDGGTSWRGHGPPPAGGVQTIREDSGRFLRRSGT